MRPSDAFKVDQIRTVWPSQAQDPRPRLPNRYDPTLRWDASTGGPDSVRLPAREEESEPERQWLWLLRCWEWVLRQRYYWIVVFVSLFVCMVVLLIGGWRPGRKRQVKEMEGGKEASKAEDDVLAENPNDSPTLAHDKADWREIRSRLLISEYGDIDDEMGKEQDMLTRITIQQDKRAERRAVFAFLWFGGLVGGWGGLGGYYVFLKPSGTWEDLLWVGFLVAMWGFFVFEVGDIVAIVWLREKRVDFPPAMKPRGGWGSRVFEITEVGYPVLLEEKVSGSILQFIMKLFRRWVLVEGRQRGIERRILYNVCLHIRDTIELDIAERRETHDTDRVFADLAVQGTMMGELCESPLEDVVAVRDAIGDDRVPIAERAVGRPRGVRRRETRQRQMGTEAESSTRRVTRSRAKEMEVEISSETTDVDHSDEGLARLRARGPKVWSSGQIQAYHDWWGDP